jgi:hypothetical protein
MRDRFLSACDLGRFLDVPLRSGSLFSSSHNFTETELSDKIFCVPTVAAAS